VSEVGIVGLGIHPVGRHPGVSGLEMATAAARAALADAGVDPDDVVYVNAHAPRNCSGAM